MLLIEGTNFSFEGVFEKTLEGEDECGCEANICEEAEKKIQRDSLKEERRRRGR